MILRGLHLASTLRGRVSSLTAGAVALAMLVTGITTYLIASWSLYAQLDHDLMRVATAQADTIAEDYNTLGGVDPTTLKVANVKLELLSPTNQLINPTNDPVDLKVGPEELSVAKLQAGSSARTVRASDGRQYRLVAVPLTVTSGSQLSGPYAVIVARPLASVQTMIDTLNWTLLLLTIAMAVAAWLGGSWVARSALAPVRRLSDAVARVTETDQLEPVAVQGNDEMAEFARSFNTMMFSLESSRERQRRLIADAGHELRTPLTSMRTNIELLVADDKTGMLPAGARGDILNDVALQLTEFSNLVGDLVQLAREDRVQPAPEPVDLADVVTNAVERVRRRGPTLTFDVETHEHLLLGEADQLERAITNLLDNAVKFSPPMGTIRVRMDETHLVISDEGPGIADEDLPRIFDRFFRADTARNTPGTGLGLSIVSQTIAAHGGTIEPGRAESGGAQFTITLPRTDAIAPAEA